MRNNPSDWVLSDLERIASHFNIVVRQGKGSHVYFSFLHGATLSVPAKRPIKAIYVLEFLALLEIQLEPKE
jgi:hypothetical protein